MIVFTWGRFNPPHKGHEKLITKMKDLSENAQVFLSHSYDEKNPLDYKYKFQLMQQVFGDVVIHSDIKTIIGAIRYVRSLDDTAIFVIGEDRVKEFGLLFYKYNDREFNFKSIQVVSAGKRNSESSNFEETISSSKMKYWANKNMVSEFTQGLPLELQDLALEIIEKVNSYGKLN